MLISGGPGNDVIDGSNDPDEIHGEDGDDTLYGHGGDDLLFGGNGDDVLFGGAGDDTLDGGAGNDTLWTGSGNNTIVFRDGYGSDVVMDFTPGSDVVWLTASGIETWDDLLPRLTTDPDGTAVLVLDDGSRLRFEGLTLDELSESDFIIDPPPVCLARGTPLAVPGGTAPVEALRPDDLVLTRDHGAQPVLWIGRRTQRFGHGPHRHRPVVFAPGTLGGGLPRCTLRLSPQHRVLIRGKGRGRFADGALAFARSLSDTCRTGAIVQDQTVGAIEYFQLLLPRHAILDAAGVGVESFYPGPFAIETLPSADRAHIEALFPGVSEDAAAAYGPFARPVLRLRDVCELPAEALQALPAAVARAA